MGGKWRKGQIKWIDNKISWGWSFKSRTFEKRKRKKLKENPKIGIIVLYLYFLLNKKAEAEKNKDLKKESIIELKEYPVSRKRGVGINKIRQRR